MSAQILTPDEIRTYIQDQAATNYLLAAEEFSDIEYALAIELAVSEWNMLSPMSSDTVYTLDFRFKSLFMNGALGKLYLGAATKRARNQMEYTDGGLTVNVEERADIYLSLANMYISSFRDTAKQAKININMESGYSHVSSDYNSFPTF